MTAYLSRKQVAERLGVAPASLSRYKLPEPDATIGDVRGWLPDTIDAWNESRPGSGRWR
ncbi:helix-turn-helix transcriptional regulator [Microbacterium excoecariae]|uniref:helix-turn-helix transcriptional regulator n=1 Tax=Microbacterium excoecariae TaxID=2715210 RepID=UPI00140B5434|nr:helix-turn-helix transcriptional regulator [Microbacterium excoecariae]NHI16887.1 helix-turn-helix transcriptional regulator [Microbacterium excoecariae]